MQRKLEPLDAQQLKNAAIRLLCRREYSREELYLKLSSRTDSQATLSSVLDSLEGEGLQSDDRYTEVYIRSRLNKGFGPIKIAYELKAKKVDQYLVDKWLAEMQDRVLEVAFSVGQKKYNQLLGTGLVTDADELPIETQKANRDKLYRYLLTKGFDASLVRQVLNELVE